MNATLENPVDSNHTGIGFGSKVILWNCDCHSFDQVENMLIKATHCGLGKARSLAHEIHNKGSAVVYSGHFERCEAVAETLSSTGLKTTIEK